MKVAEIKTALKRYGFNDKDPLLEWINAAYHEIESAHTKWSFLEESEVGTISPGEDPDGRFNVSGGVKRFIKVRDITDEATGGGDGVDLEFWDRRKLQREIPNLRAVGKPEIFSILGASTIQVYPVPSDEREIESTYIQELPDLVDDEDEPLIPVANHYTIVRGAAYIGLQAENEEERAASAQAQFESDLQKMIDGDLARQLGAPSSVEDVEEYA